MDIIVSNAPATEVSVNGQPPLELTVSNAPSVDVSLGASPTINVLMETKVVGNNLEPERRLAELERKFNELEQSTIMPLYE